MARSKIVGEGAPFDELVATPTYGENRWQGNPGLYKADDSQDPLALSNFTLELGTDPSYNNYRDIDRLLQTATHIAAVFDRNHGYVPLIALGAKHGNVCGAGAIPGTTALEPGENGSNRKPTIRKMLDGDPRAIFGGSVMVNFEMLKHETFELISHGMKEGQKRLLDVVASPEVTGLGIGILERKAGKLRLLTNPALEKLDEKSLDTAQRFVYVRGGVLVQDNYTFVLDHSADYVERHGTEMTDQQERDLSLAWAIGSTSNSNTITLVRDGMLIGNGVGQQDRVGAAELAVKRATDAGHSVEGAVAYSDSFFPFPDGPKILTDAGVTAILTSRGSIRDDEVFGSITDAGASVETIPDAIGRGFYAH